MPDENQSILAWLKGLVTGSGQPEPKTYLAEPMKQYPTSDDVDFARKYDYSYGQLWAPEFENRSARLLTGNPNVALTAKTPTQFPAQTFNTARITDKRADVLKDYYAKAALAAEASPLAKLGFDPNRAALDIIRDPEHVNLLGVHQPDADDMYVNARVPGNIIHESIHRGIQKLRESPYWKPEFEPQDEEMVVRHLMQSKMGDPRKEMVERSIAQTKPGEPNEDVVRLEKAARALFNPEVNLWAGTRRKHLDDMEQAAANYIAAKRPGGPR
jgi:hypothetical protein